MPSLANKTMKSVTTRNEEPPEIDCNSMPLVSVVLVADHDTARHAGLEDLRSCLQALALQKVDQPVEFLLVESEERARQLPADLIATWISQWHGFASYQDDPAVRSILVSCLTNILINVLTA